MILDHFPPGFTPRPLQVDILQQVEAAFATGVRFVVLEAPPGVGKSLVEVTLARSMKSAIVCTVTKQLQTQIITEFEGIGARELKGRGSFECSRLEEPGSCELGAEKFRRQPCRPSECPYRVAKAEALKSDLTVCNYHSYLFNWGIGTFSVQAGIAPFDDEEAQWRRPLLVLDEAHKCFIAGTQVDGRRIEDIRVGDRVRSFDPIGGASVEREVKSTMRSKPSGLVAVRVSGRRIVCTPDHPFWTRDGWTAASSLSGKYVLSNKANESYWTADVDVQMSHLQRSVRGERTSKVDLQPSRQAQSTDLLFPYVPPEQVEESVGAELRSVSERNRGDREVTVQSSPVPPDVLLQSVPEPRDDSAAWADETTCASNALRADDPRQSDEGPSHSSESVYCLEGDGLEATNSGREWASADRTRTAPDGSARMDESGRSDTYQKGRWLPHALQSGCRGTEVEDRDRNRRTESPSAQGEARRREKGELLAWTRVDDVEILEQSSDGTFGGVCPDGHVYNLEVEGTHTYFVDGVVVHNCESVLLDHTSVTVNATNLPIPLDIPFPDANSAPGCFAWLQVFLLDASEVMEREEQTQTLTIKARKELKSLMGKAQFALDHHKAEEWIAEPLGEGQTGFVLKPLTVRSFAHKVFKYGDRVLLMSATILDAAKVTESLGIKPDEYVFVRTDCPFPVANREVIVSGLSMTKAHRGTSWPLMIDQIKMILQAHEHEKGLLLTTSNEMLNYIYAELPGPLRARLILARGVDRLVDYKRHLNSMSPSVLAAPGFWEGADLKNELSRFQILPAVPRPYWGGQVAARATIDPDWYRMQSYQQLIQGVGRSVRSEKDYAVTYVLDAELKREAGRKDTMLPKWFRDALVFA